MVQLSVEAERLDVQLFLKFLDEWPQLNSYINIAKREEIQNRQYEYINWNLKNNS